MSWPRKLCFEHVGVPLYFVMVCLIIILVNITFLSTYSGSKANGVILR